MAIIDTAIAVRLVRMADVPDDQKAARLPTRLPRAVANEPEVRDLFGRHVDATGISVACGASGLLIVDLVGEDRG